MVSSSKRLSLSPKKMARFSSSPNDPDTSSQGPDLQTRLPTPLARTLSEVPSYERIKRSQTAADHHLKFVVVGDGAVGKTCLLISYTQGSFPEEYVPTVFENYVTKMKGPGNAVIELALWDTAGQEEYNRLRPLSYTDVDLLMVCYSVDSKTSLHNVQELWIPEVRHFCPDTPIMLVGLKSDLYALDNLEKLVDPKDAELFAQQMGLMGHYQCSAKYRSNIDELFNVAITTLLYDSIQDRRGRSVVNLFKTKRSTGVFEPVSKRRKHACCVL
ncbi:LAQU0S18e01112g1_1 [Lachancea quebecensis]|uniref:GTP-binding protein RHO4 n=1 Tax=Lachancea quebecensis TaxID=1654605 RepID=A0A0P1KX95_9SACH|nr:LAQU0S18e01112g1_1 [Lachancea quebecensis]